MTLKIMLSDDGRIYAGRTSKELVKVMYKTWHFGFDDARNYREWMKGISERRGPIGAGRKIATGSTSAFLRGCVRAGIFTRLDQGSKVQP